MKREDGEVCVTDTKVNLDSQKYMPTRRAGKLFILSELQILPVSLRKIWQTA